MEQYTDPLNVYWRKLVLLGNVKWNKLIKAYKEKRNGGNVTTE